MENSHQVQQQQQQEGADAIYDCHNVLLNSPATQIETHQCRHSDANHTSSSTQVILSRISTPVIVSASRGIAPKKYETLLNHNKELCQRRGRFITWPANLPTSEISFDTATPSSSTSRNTTATPNSFSNCHTNNTTTSAYFGENPGFVGGAAMCEADKLMLEIMSMDDTVFQHVPPTTTRAASYSFSPPAATVSNTSNGSKTNHVQRRGRFLVWPADPSSSSSSQPQQQQQRRHHTSA